MAEKKPVAPAGSAIFPVDAEGRAPRANRKDLAQAAEILGHSSEPVYMVPDGKQWGHDVNHFVAGDLVREENVPEPYRFEHALARGTLVLAPPEVQNSLGVSSSAINKAQSARPVTVASAREGGVDPNDPPKSDPEQRPAGPGLPSPASTEGHEPTTRPGQTPAKPEGGGDPNRDDAKESD